MVESESSDGSSSCGSGALDQAVVQRLESSDEAALERFAERPLTAHTDEEVLAS